MKEYKIQNQYMNYLNNIARKNIVYFRRTPINYDKNTYYGEKVKESKNYILFASGNQKSYYEFLPCEMHFKLSDNSLKNNLSYIKNKTTNNNNNNNKSFDPVIARKRKERPKILKSADNYGYKEIKNIKNYNPNIKMITKHDMETDKSPDKYNNTKYTNIQMHKKNTSRNVDRNQGFKILQENKSCDNIIHRSKYRYKINNEYNRNNHKSKIVKITRNNKGNLKQIYQKKYIKKNECENEPLYIANYGENSENNYEAKTIQNYGIRNYYYINNNYDEYDGSNNNRKNDIGNESIEDIYDENNFNEEVTKNIQCPIHGNISIIVHRKPSKLNKKNINIYKK